MRDLARSNAAPGALARRPAAPTTSCAVLAAVPVNAVPQTRQQLPERRFHWSTHTHGIWVPIACEAVLGPRLYVSPQLGIAVPIAPIY